MSRLRLRFMCAVLCLTAARLHADPTPTYQWTGSAGDSDFTNPDNWSGSVVPDVLSGDAALTFSGTSPVSIDLPASVLVSTLTFAGGDSDTVFYNLNGPSAIVTSQGLKVDDNNTAGAVVQLGADIALIADGTQTWEIGAQRLEVHGNLGSAGTVSLQKDGSGDLSLFGTTSFQGTLAIGGGNLRVSDSTLSDVSGLTIAVGANGGLSGTDNGTRATIASAVTLDSGATLGTAADTSSDNRTRLDFGSSVAVSGEETTIQLARDSINAFAGDFTGDGETGTAVTFTGGGAVILAGTTASSIARITADGSGVFFGSTTSVPDSVGFAVTARNDGYIGLGEGFSGHGDNLSPNDLIAVVDASGFSGTIGFDTDPDILAGGGSPQTFTGDIDLTRFADTPGFLGLGSATAATLDAESSITLASGQNYLFGGGGGRLTVQTSLSSQHDDWTGLSVVSPHYEDKSYDRPLTVVLQGDNTFTGAIHVENSYLIFDSQNALPSGAPISLGAAGYVSGTENWGQWIVPDAGSLPGGAQASSIFVPYTPADLIGALHGQAIDPTAVIGFDSSAPASFGRQINEPVDLNGLGLDTDDPNALPYLGTTTFGPNQSTGHAGLELTGTISVPAGMTLKLAGVDGGRLLVSSDLTGNDGQNITKVVIGHPTDYALGADGTVSLTGENTYTDGTTLLSGTLALSTSSQYGDGMLLSGPIGLGDLTVGDGTGNDVKLLAEASVALGNNVVLTDGSTLRLATSDSEHGFEFDGVFSGSGQLVVDGVDTLLNADNCGFTGLTTIKGATVTLGNGKALVHSTVDFDADTASTLITTGDAYLAGLTGGREAVTAGAALPEGQGARLYGSLVELAAGSTLTVENYSDNDFKGVIADATTDGGGALHKAGSGELGLYGSNTYTGGTLVTDGLLVAHNNDALGTGAVTVQAGGGLGVDHDIFLANAITLDGSASEGSEHRAVIGGFGTVAPESLTVGYRTTLSPGAKLAPNRGSDAAPVGTFSLGFVGNDLNLPTSVSFAADGRYDWGVQFLCASDGVGSDLIAITGTLSFNLAAGEVFEFKITSFDDAGDAGFLKDFDNQQSHEWVVLTATGGITGFDPTKIKFDATGFLNSPNDFLFGLEQRAFGDGGSELVLTFNPAAVPEPSTWALLLTGLAFVGWCSRRRVRRS